MSIPKEPRQLMINLMYLVLTAMLALNVSNEILNAFKIINKSIARSNGSIEQKNVDVMGQFQANMELPDQKARIEQYYMKAQDVRKQSQDLYNYMEQWKRRVILQGGGYARTPGADTTLPEKEDDIDAGTFLLVEHGGGDTVMQRLQAYREYLLSKVNDDGRRSLSQSLAVRIDTPQKTEHNPQGSWAFEMFHYVPSTAVMTLFSKLQNDIRVSEAQVLDRLFTEANAKTLKFDAITAIAVPQTSYAMVGQPIEAKIMFAAYNKSVSPVIRPSSGNVEVKDGIGTWKGTANGTGLQTVKGTLTLDVMGTPQTQNWEFNYMVGSIGGSVQLDKMNVFYIGVDNPITVSASGYNLDDVDVSIDGCDFVKTSLGKYVVRPRTPGLTNVIVTGKRDNVSKPIATTPIRIKELPTPRPFVANKNGGPVQSGLLRAQIGIEARLENFDFVAGFTVTEYDISNKKKGQSNVSADVHINGAYFSGDAKAIMGSATAGDRIYLDNIKAKGPDGKIRSLGSITIIVI